MSFELFAYLPASPSSRTADFHRQRAWRVSPRPFGRRAEDEKESRKQKEREKYFDGAKKAKAKERKAFWKAVFPPVPVAPGDTRRRRRRRHSIVAPEKAAISAYWVRSSALLPPTRPPPISWALLPFRLVTNPRARTVHPEGGREGPYRRLNTEISRPSLCL